MKTALTTTQRQRLAAAKSDIRKGRDLVGQGFAIVCRALRAVHDDALWVEEADTFADWCRDVVEESRATVYRMIQADVEGVSAIADNLGQARELFGLPQGQARTVVELAEVSQPKTAATIRTARAMLAGKTPEQQIQTLQAARSERREVSAVRGRVNAAAGIVGILNDARGRLEKARGRLGQVPDVADEAEEVIAGVLEQIDRAIQIVRTQAEAA